MIQERRQRGSEKRKKTNVDMEGLSTFILILFRVPLGVLVTDETNGYLAIAWEIYSLFYLFFGFACSEIVSKLVKDRVEKGSYKNSLRSMHTMMIAGSFLACFGAVILYGTSGYLLPLFPGKKQVEISLLLFAFLLPFSTGLVFLEVILQE
jgi:O-antigen/teichoic acid export membrane protein